MNFSIENLAYLLAAYIIIRYTIYFSRVFNRLLFKNDYGPLIIKVREHGNINSIIIILVCVLVIAFLLFIFFKTINGDLFRYSEDSDDANYQLALLIPLIFPLIYAIILNALKTYAFIEVREDGILTSSGVYKYCNIESFSWEETSHKSWDKEDSFYYLKLAVQKRKLHEEVLHIRKSDHDALDSVLRSRIKCVDEDVM